MRFRAWVLPFLVASVGAFYSPPVHADEQDPTIKLPEGTALIPDLHFSSVEVKPLPRPTAIVKGEFKRKDWELGTNFSLGQIQVDSKGIFQLVLPLSAVDTPASVFAVGLRGETETQKFVIHYPRFVPEIKAKPKKVAYSPSLGFSTISYTESAIGINISELAVTGKMGVDYPTSDRVHIGGSIYMTLLPMTNGDSIRFVGVNLRAAYYFNPPENPWCFSMAAGLYYATTFANAVEPEKKFGFYNLSGPQLYPVLVRNFPKGDFLQAYFKVSLISYGSKLLSPGQNEFAGGFSYGFKLKSDHHVSVGLDFAKLSLSIPEGNVSATSTSLGFGYGF